MLTKQQRLDAYTYAYLELLAEGNQPVCLLIKDYIFTQYLQVVWSWETILCFPEFLKQKPEDKLFFQRWFQNKDQRLAALERAIALCEQAKD